MAIKITYREVGTHGPLLMLLHGYGGSVLHWDEMVEDLSRHFRVIIPNLSHLYMSSDKLLFTVQIEVLAEFIRTHYHNEKINLMGTSFGGAIAWGLALQHPQLVQEIFFVNPLIPDPIPHFIVNEIRYFFRLPLTEKATQVLFATPIGKIFLRKIAQIFRDERAEGKLALETLSGRKLQFLASMVANLVWIVRSEDWTHWWGRLNSLPVKNTFIFDKDDALFGPDTYRSFAAHLGSERIVELNGAGHLAIKTRPRLISNIVLEQLTEQNEKTKKEAA